MESKSFQTKRINELSERTWSEYVKEYILFRSTKEPNIKIVICKRETFCQTHSPYKLP